MSELSCWANALLVFILDVRLWMVTVPLLIAIWTWNKNEKSKREWESWQLRKAACLKALNIANALISNYKFEHMDVGGLVPQEEKIEEVRACMNELACVCNGPEVLNLMKKIMFCKVRADIIVDLRNAVRKELGMHIEDIDNDREKAFVGSVGCDPRCKAWGDSNK